MKNNGFTLLETTIYIALFAMLMTGALVTVYALLGSITSNQTFESTYSEGLFIQQKLAWELSRATSVTIDNSQVLQIIQPDKTLWFFASGSSFWLRDNSLVAVPLSTAEFVVANVQMELVPATPGASREVYVRYTIGGMPFRYRATVQP